MLDDDDKLPRHNLQAADGVGCEAEGDADGGEGGETGGGEAAGEADGGEGGEGGETAVVEVVATPWAPKDVDELLREIADDNYGVSDDRSTALATPAIKAHNAELRKANAQIDVEMVACSDAQTLAAIEAYNAKVAACAIKAYNAKASMYEQVVQKRGQPLREGFTIVKVRAARARFREL